MKVLVMYVRNFSYKTAETSVEEVEFIAKQERFENAILAFVQVEEKDEEKDFANRGKKLSNHLKWTARKNNTQNIILHSFAHLSESKASSDYTLNLLNNCEERLASVDYIVAQTPFAHFLDLTIDAPGFSLARIWADL
ncbi:MAG: threonyl-tRNA synthetase editing domain-containing protein [Mangrovibacterium sp.]